MSAKKKETGGNEADRPEFITVRLSQLQAGFAIAALQQYAREITKNSMARFVISLTTGADPRETAREAGRVIDEAGCAAFGGEPYTDAEFYGDETEDGDGSPETA